MNKPVAANFSELLAFGRTMAILVTPFCGEPIAYGSLAFAAHTGDWRFGLSDLDFLIPGKSFPEALAAFRSNRGFACEPTAYHTIKLRRGELKLSFDSLDHYMAGISFQRTPVEAGGIGFQAIDAMALIMSYERAAETIPMKREAYLAKLELLRQIAGR